MRPVPETETVLNELMAKGDIDLAQELRSMAERAQGIVPQCVGLSVALHKYGLTFTIAASDEEIATLDATQYLDGGPCVAAIEDNGRLDVDFDDLLDEGRWSFYARAGAAAGVGSSLSMPIMRRDHVVGGVNLYASTADAFHERHEELAEALGTSAEAAISDADLGFTTRKTAAEAPGILSEDQDIATALEMITERHRVDRITAWEVLQDSAVRAGISPVAVARALRHLLDDDGR